MNSCKLFIRKRILWCLISIVTWLVLHKGEHVFSLLSSSALNRRPRHLCVANTLAIKPCYYIQHHWPPRSFVCDNSRLLCAPDDISTIEREQHEVEDKSVAILGKDDCSTGTVYSRNRNDGCVVELIEPETNCSVRIIGVFHGSDSSSRDVFKYVTASSDMVVLELCSDRHRDLVVKQSSEASRRKRPVDSDRDNSEYDEEISESRGGAETQIQRETAISRVTSKSWFELYRSAVKDTLDRQGWRTGIVVAIFGLVNGFQEQILKFQPGLEFLTASGIASNFSIPIVLADQDVSITLQRIGQIPQIAFELLGNFCRERSWDTTFGPMSSALSLAVFGGWIYVFDDRLPQMLSLPQFLIRNSDSVLDLLRFLGLPFLIVQALHAIFSMDDAATAIDTAAAHLSTQHCYDQMISTWVNITVFILFYLCVALPATQVILIERDDTLTAGIQAACRLAQRNSLLRLVRKSESMTEARQDVEVVVVLGMLHVNGVALRLTKKYDQILQVKD